MGADPDTRASVEATVQFVLDRDIAIAYFFPLWGHYLEPKNGFCSITPRHRAIFRGWGYCDGNFVSHFPKNMRPSQLQAELIRAHQRVYSVAAIGDMLRQGKYRAAWEKATHQLMWSAIQTGLHEHVHWLQEMEAPYYDAQDRLLEETLLDDYRNGVPWQFAASQRFDHPDQSIAIQAPQARTKNFQCPPLSRPEQELKGHEL